MPYSLEDRLIKKTMFETVENVQNVTVTRIASMQKCVFGKALVQFVEQHLPKYKRGSHDAEYYVGKQWGRWCDYLYFIV